MSAQNNKPKPKGILKNKGHHAPDPTPDPTSQQRHEIAVKHARIIHSRRDIEDQISDSMIELSKFPTVRDAPYSVTNPAPADAEAFKRLVRLYQPGDYDDLIEERNANDMCGYTLCPKARSRVTSGGTFKLVNYGRKDFNIVPSRELERWCSQKCAKRAMYVKVQLNESAAWERAGIDSIEIDLFEEDQTPAALDATNQPAKEIENDRIAAQEKKAQNARDLALERGDSTENGKPRQRSIKLSIREKPVNAPVAPSLGPDDHGHLITEGYKTTFDPKTETVGHKDKETSREDAIAQHSDPVAE